MEVAGDGVGGAKELHGLVEEVALEVVEHPGPRLVALPPHAASLDRRPEAVVVRDEFDGLAELPEGEDAVQGARKLPSHRRLWKTVRTTPRTAAREQSSAASRDVNGSVADDVFPGLEGGAGGREVGGRGRGHHDELSIRGEEFINLGAALQVWVGCTGGLGRTVPQQTWVQSGARY